MIIDTFFRARYSKKHLRKLEYSDISIVYHKGVGFFTLNEYYLKQFNAPFKWIKNLNSE